VAITCADIGVRADELELPVPLDRRAYQEALTLLESRGIIEHGRLSAYGKAVEAMPVDRPWAELLVHAEDELLPYVAVMSAVESLHRMTREERDLEGLVVPGSDHLTAYNVYAEAYRQAGYVGEVYGLPRHLFHDEEIAEWAEARGVLVKAIEDAALGMASVYRSVGMPLPLSMPMAGDRIRRQFGDLLARIMPFDLVIDEHTVDGREARVSKTSVCGSWGPIAGELRYFADKFGTPRASIEGTQIPLDVLRKYAHADGAELQYDADRRREPLVVRRAVTYFGFELEREAEPVPEPWPPELVDQIRRTLAGALARFEARHVAAKRNRDAVEELREVYRRSGGATARLGQRELGERYEREMAERDIQSMEDFRAAPFRIDPDALVPRAERERWLALPDAVEVRGREVPIDYDVEERDGAIVGVARLRLPEKLARTLTDAELPVLDRPVRFVVTRGQRGAVRAPTLDELQDLLERPWSPDEVAAEQRARDERRERKNAERQGRRARDAERELRHQREGGGGGGRGRNRARRRRFR
jgi:hypothetical protein